MHWELSSDLQKKTCIVDNTWAVIFMWCILLHCHHGTSGSTHYRGVHRQWDALCCHGSFVRLVLLLYNDIIRVMSNNIITRLLIGRVDRGHS